jgi:hypothetical protein
MNKTQVIRARCEPNEHAALLAIAQHEHRRPSEVLRAIVREAAKRRGLWPPSGGNEVNRHAAA